MRLLSLIRELWTHLPAWFFLFTVGRITLINITSLPNGPRHEWAWTAAAPILVVLIYYWRRLDMQKGLGRAQDLFGVVTLVAMAAVLGPYYLAPEASAALRPGGSPNAALVWAHEITTFVWVGLLVLHCLWFRGWRGVVMFYVIGLAYGTALESSGTVNGFFYEQGYNYEFGREYFAPLATILGWTTVFYPTVHIAQTIWRGTKSRPLLIGITAATAGTLLDLNVDPVATEAHLWFWNDLLAQGPHFCGVPLLNFASWFFALVPFATFLVWIEGRGDWSTLRKFATLAVAVPVSQGISGVCLVVCMWLIEGWGGPTLTILRQGLGLGG
ncbi:MAG: carotenoid biosynthesis protein [Candidatus Alcyoniella australis]|nr:carotenoid biosynthesis protein [Candidatus Alcyoniella australis]